MTHWNFLSESGRMKHQAGRSEGGSIIWVALSILIATQAQRRCEGLIFMKPKGRACRWAECLPKYKDDSCTALKFGFVLQHRNHQRWSLFKDVLQSSVFQFGHKMCVTVCSRITPNAQYILCFLHVVWLKRKTECEHSLAEHPWSASVTCGRVYSEKKPTRSCAFFSALINTLIFLFGFTPNSPFIFRPNIALCLNWKVKGGSQSASVRPARPAGTLISSISRTQILDLLILCADTCSHTVRPASFRGAHGRLVCGPRQIPLFIFSCCRGDIILKGRWQTLT